MHKLKHRLKLDYDDPKTGYCRSETAFADPKTRFCPSQKRFVTIPKPSFTILKPVFTSLNTFLSIPKRVLRSQNRFSEDASSYIPLYGYVALSTLSQGICFSRPMHTWVGWGNMPLEKKIESKSSLIKVPIIPCHASSESISENIFGYENT